MTRDSINIQYPTSDSTDSIQVLQSPTASTVTQANGIKVANAFKCKDNTLTIVVNNTYATADSTITFKSGVYQNALLGDLSKAITKSATAIIKIENPSRFEQADGSLYIDFSSGFTGTIYAFGKKAGLG